MGVKKLLRRARASGARRSPTQRKFEKTETTVKKPKQKKTLVIAQEIKFARILASNDKKARAKMLKNLRSWITVRSKSSFAFTETDFMRVWKGLFYCMWMSDKPLVQEELAESISNLVHCFDSLESALLYTKCTFRTLSAEWFGIDQYRVDKFQMLVRRILRQTFVVCRKREWSEESVRGVGGIVEELLSDAQGTLGFKFHVVEIYMEELAKVGEGRVPEAQVTELLRPFAVYLASTDDERQIRHVVKHIFRYLIFQSDVGIEYAERFEAWRRAGYPTGSIDAMQKVEASEASEEDDEEEEEEEEEEVKAKALDPRAGRVDVDLPQVPFDPHQVAELIRQYKFHPSSTTKSRRQITRLIREFAELAKGEMPLGVQRVDVPMRRSAETNPKRAALRLLEFEDELYTDANGRSRKKKRKVEEKSKSDAEETPEKNAEKLEDKKKNLQKEFKVKGTKVKKRKSLKKPLNVELQDGIDDFANFKRSPVTRKSKKQDLNGSWDVSTEPTSAADSQKPDVHVELPGKRQVEKIPWLLPVVKKLEDERKVKPAEDTKKRVKIVLQRNTAQHTSEYIRQLRLSPQIPYDANRKPRAGVLKPSPLASPVNPFYKKL